MVRSIAEPEKLLASEDAARLAKENGKEFVFVSSEIERVTAAGDAHGIGFVVQE